MVNILAIAASVGAICLIFKTGILNRFKWYHNLKSKIVQGTVGVTFGIVSAIVPKTSFKINSDGDSGIITYSHWLKVNHLHVPYSKKMARKMIGLKVYLQKREQLGNIGCLSHIDITQQRGIPYMVSARQLGGTKILVWQGEELIKSYCDDDIPYWMD